MKKVEAFLLVICFIVFGLLLFKDVFSARTLIPNFEPFPDTFNYVNPALSFLNGQGFAITREGREVKPGVPPLYSISLMPAFLVNRDPRMFYFTNVLLALVSAAFLYLTISRLTDNIWIRCGTLFLFVTNYYIYWFPTLAMSENLLLTLFLACCFLLSEKINFKMVILAAFISVGFYATKYAAAPLSAVFLLFYLWKIVSFKSNRRKAYFIYFIVFAGLFFSAHALIEYVSKGSNLLEGIIGFIHKPIDLVSSSVTDAQSIKSTGPGWFSSSYVSTNLPAYLKSLIGTPLRFLWSYEPMVPKPVGVVGLIGLAWGVVVRKTRFLSLSLVCMLLAQVLFMSTFYSLDGRYIYTAIPTLFFGVSIFMTNFLRVIPKSSTKIFYLLLGGFILLYLLSSASRIKNQIALNIKHGETPWYYVSILNLNDYFTSDKTNSGKKPVVISPMVPYLIDYFSNGNYTLLPLSKDQDYRDHLVETWGPNDYSDLLNLYTIYINRGYQVYVATYGLGNVGYLHRDFNRIASHFKLVLVKDGCYGQCNIYKLTL